MGTNNKTIMDMEETKYLELPDGTPESSFATAWFRTNKGCFSIYFTIVGPKTEEPEHHLTLTRSQAESRLKAITNLVKSFQKALRRQDPARA